MTLITNEYLIAPEVSPLSRNGTHAKMNNLELNSQLSDLETKKDKKIENSLIRIMLTFF